MNLALLEIYKSGNHYVVTSRLEKGDVAIDDRTLRVTENETEVVNVVVNHFAQFPEDRLVTVIVCKGRRMYVVKESVMRGLFLSSASKILDQMQLASEINEHMDFHVIKTLGDLAA